MPKHHTEDYKLIAVKYYLKNNTTYKNVCDIFMCSERSLKRWIIRYEKDKSLLFFIIIASFFLIFESIYILK